MNTSPQASPLGWAVSRGVWLVGWYVAGNFVALGGREADGPLVSETKSVMPGTVPGAKIRGVYLEMLLGIFRSATAHGLSESLQGSLWIIVHEMYL